MSKNTAEGKSTSTLGMLGGKTEQPITKGGAKAIGVRYVPDPNPEGNRAERRRAQKLNKTRR